MFVRKRYWKEAMFTKDEIIVFGKVGKDGLLVSFDWRDDLGWLERLLEKRPMRYNLGRREWYFNETYDRLIAEENPVMRTIEANPQLLWQAGYTIHS